MIERMKKAHENTQLSTLATAYLIAKIKCETIKAEAERIQTEVLRNNDFYYDAVWIEKGMNPSERITNPHEIYLAHEDEWNRFYSLCYPLYQAAGIADDRGQNYVCEAKAHDEMKKYENEMIEMFISEFTGLDDVVEKMNTAKKHWKYRERLINLILDVV